MWVPHFMLYGIEVYELPFQRIVKWQSNNVTDIRTFEVKQGSAADGVCQISSKSFKNFISSKF